MATVPVPPVRVPAATLPTGSISAASAGNTAFFVIFGIFIVAMLVLVVIVVVWAVRHDMAGRAAWRERQLGRAEDPATPPEEQ